MFYDASNLISANKQYLQEEVSGYTYATYSLPAGDEVKCRRDLGYLIDAIVYHLRFGGNEKVVNFARLYYTNAGYPSGETLTFINRTAEETTAAIDAWNKLGEKMILAMRNNLGAGTYTSITPVTDLSIALDSEFPFCAEVESAINSMIQVVQDILANGTGAVDATPINSSKPGNWSPLTPYTDYNLIADTALTAGECDDVVSSVDSLYDNIEDILNSLLVSKTLPDYVDGENKVFELYWEDGSEVSTEEDEDLFLTLNAVLQRPKYTENYPGEDSYRITRDTIPNKLVFDVAPIWDQDFGAKSIGEPTAVEKVVGIGVGNYKRLTIDYDLVNGTRTGPFLILDVEDNTVQSIEDKEYLYVFLDGVLQREGFSYTVSGPNIFFNVPIKKQMKIDMRYLYGRDVGQILNIYDFAPDTYFATGTLVIETTASNITDFLSYQWMGNLSGSGIHCWQQKPDGTYNVIGKVANPYVSGSLLKLDVVRAQNAEIIPGLDITFAVEGRYSRTFVMLDVDITSAVLNLETDDDGRKILSSEDAFWFGTVFRRHYKNPFVSLSNGDKIRVEGEDKFRNIKVLPSKTISKDGRNNEQLSDDIFGSVEVETYSGVTRGEGLSVIANVENGVVTSLTWNQRSFDPLTQPTAYQYFTPPVLEFIPQDGTGGGARAEVIVSKGQVISVDLIDGGSGYTKAPKVVVARRYEILNERDIGVSLINVGINPYVEVLGMTASSTIDVINLPEPRAFTTSAVVAESPSRVDIDLIAQLQLIRQNDNVDVTDRSVSQTTETKYNNTPLINVFTQTNEYVSQISGRVADIISNSVVTASRQITSTVHNIIQNNALSNVNYFEVAAYTDVDTPANATIIYIPDTSKFKTNGYLMIGDEMVRYMRKLSDRFLMVERGQKGTTPQFWPAGTYLRQVPDPVSVAPAGVTNVFSEASVIMVGASSGIGEGQEGQDRIRYQQLESPDVTLTTTSRVITAEIQPQLDIQSVTTVSTTVRYRLEPNIQSIPSTRVSYSEVETEVEIQTVQSQFIIQKAATEVVLTPPASGVVDGYEESVYIADPISTRLNGFVDLNDDYGVVQRSGNIIYVTNLVFGTGSDYVGNYTRTNAGYVIGHFDGIFDDGYSNVSGLSIQELSTYFASLTIRDFTDRRNSQYTLAGNKFNLLPPSIQSPATIATSTGALDGGSYGGTATTFNVSSTNQFPDSGYLYLSTTLVGVGGALVSYTGKTATSFTGCVVVREHDVLGTNGGLIVAGDTNVIPYSIS